MGRIELNADVGEGGADALIMPYVERVSIACGGHAGDTATMRATLLLARTHGVMAGAHPGYPDRANFGRVALPAEPAAIRHWVLTQTRALQEQAEALGMRLFHVKPHGALYNQAAWDAATAQGVIDAMRELEGLALVALAGSPLVGWARAAGLVVLEEAFADRRYLQNGMLAPRSEPNAVIDEPKDVAAQAEAIACGRPFATLDGGKLTLKADTLCLHGEGARAAELARLVRAVLERCST